MRVVGRGAELAAIDAFLAGRRAALLIAGPLGAGKTVLWEQGVVRAGRLGDRVLVARPVATEAALGYAALADLLDSTPASLIDALPAPQRRALRVALLQEESDVDGRADRSVATATVGVLRALAAIGPVLLAIDDIAYLDPPTARVLSFALRRLAAAPVRVLASVRTDDGTVGSLVTDALRGDQVARLTVGPLRRVDIRALLVDQLGGRPAPALVNRVYAMSDGNPLLATELARALAHDGEASAVVADLPVPLTLRRLVQDRLAGLGTGVREALLTAALAPTAAVEAIVEALGTADARARLETAAAAGVVHLHTGRVVFTHPLLRSVVIDEAAPASRRAAHRCLAEYAPTSIERAAHLARSRDRPNRAIAMQLDAAALQADARGLPDAAAELAGLAVAATPRADADARAARLLAAAGYRFSAGDAESAFATVRALIADLPAGPGRARALSRLAVYQRYRGEPLDRWQATLRQALAEAPDTDPDLLLELHYGLGVAAMNSGAFAEAPAHVRAVADLAGRCADPAAARARVATAQLWVSFFAGDGVPADLLAAALSPVDGAHRLEPENRPSYTAALALAFSGDIPAARPLFEGDYAEAMDRGDEAVLPLLLWPLVLIETWTGNWDRAAELAASGLDAATLSDVDIGTAFVSAARAHLYAGQGEVEPALTDAATVDAVAARIGVVWPRVLGAWGGAVAALSMGDSATAHRLLAPLAAAALATGIPEPGLALFVPDAVEALVRLGDLDQACRLLDMFIDRSEALGRDRARAAAARARGLLLAAEGHLDQAVAELDRALRIGANLGLPLEHARTLLVAGEVHRRARDRRRARQRLTQARTILAGLGARQWLSACDAELSRYVPAQARAPEPDGLTPTERRVAELAAQGRTTREIADAVFASTRTVETHLHRVYRKLHVRSRVELTRRLTAR